MNITNNKTKTGGGSKEIEEIWDIKGMAKMNQTDPQQSWDEGVWKG